MEIINPQEHRSCAYYECGAKPVIEVLRFERKHKEKLDLVRNKIVFMLEGSLQFSYKDYPVQLAEKGRFFFVPSGGDFNFTVTKKALVMIIRLQRNVFMCEGCTIEQLYKDKIASNVQEYSKIGIMPLEMNPPLWYFAEGLNRSITGGLTCRYYHDIKIKELFLLIRAYYSHEDLRDFFSMVLSPDTEFSEFVRANHYKYKTVIDFAQGLCMTPKNFRQKFVSVFGEPPAAWMTREKACLIHYELISGDKTIAEISDEYGFAAQSHLNRFCKREFGKNPGEIRAGKKR